MNCFFFFKELVLFRQNSNNFGHSICDIITRYSIISFLLIRVWQVVFKKLYLVGHPISNSKKHRESKSYLHFTYASTKIFLLPKPANCNSGWKLNNKNSLLLQLLATCKHDLDLSAVINFPYVWCQRKEHQNSLRF